MPKPTFEQALAECLRDLHEGRATIDSCVARWPQFPELLRHLEVRATLANVSIVPDVARITAGAAMRRALVDRASVPAGASGSLTRLLPRAMVAAAAALILAGGAAGASAAVGGPNIPARVLSTIATLIADGGDRGTQTNADLATGTATATAVPTGRGLCVGYFSGSDRARLQREDAAAFKRLADEAASVDQSVEEYCASTEADIAPAGTNSAAPGSGGGPDKAPGRTPVPNNGTPNEGRPDRSPSRTPTFSPSAPEGTAPSRVRP